MIKTKDAKPIMEQLVAMATGRTDVEVVTTEDFVNAGSLLLSTGEDSVNGCISELIGKTEIDIRAYKGKFKLINITHDAFTNRMRKISYYNTDLADLTAFNNNLRDTIGEGMPNYAPQTQHYVVPVEVFFSGNDGWKKKYTFPLVQYQQVFRTEAEFAAFMNGIHTKIESDIQIELEQRSKQLVLDRIAGTVLLAKEGVLPSECCVYVDDAFNEEFGTNYTWDQIKKQHNKEFLEWFAAYVQIISDRMEDMSVMFHDPLKKTITNPDTTTTDLYVYRHTPKANQRFIYYKPLFTMSKAKVLPEIFGPNYIAETAGEGVNYWMGPKDPTAVKIKPAIPGWAEVDSEEVEIDDVIGILFDENAMAICSQFDSAYTAQVDIDTLTQNTAWYYLTNKVNDYTENCVVFVTHNAG